MSNKENDEPQKYVTFRGLGFTPMIGGVPLFLALGLVGVGAAAMGAFIVGAPLLAIFLIVSALSIFMFFKVSCENNNKAPQVIKIKLIGFLNILKHGKIIKVDLGVENYNEKRKKFQRGFKSLFKSN